eukprot:scaffold210950_cov20-Prasinocladus_malaysianus.AAC.1
MSFFHAWRTSNCRPSCSWSRQASNADYNTMIRKGKACRARPRRHCASFGVGRTIVVRSSI